MNFRHGYFVFLKMNEVKTCHFTENYYQYLLPMIKFEFLSPSGEPGVSGDSWGSQEGCQGPFRPSGRNRGLPLRRRGGQGPHLAKRWKPCGFSRAEAGFSSYDGDLSLPLGLALGSPIFSSGCEGQLGVALESLQGRRDLT